jgi:hypothetical protein
MKIIRAEGKTTENVRHSRESEGGSKRKSKIDLTMATKTRTNWARPMLKSEPEFESELTSLQNVIIE